VKSIALTPGRLEIAVDISVVFLAQVAAWSYTVADAFVASLGILHLLPLLSELA
jgi:hypothetical protein